MPILVRHRSNTPASPAARLDDAAPPPVDVPAGYVGPAWLPGTGRMIWWTGRVAIGLRHTPLCVSGERVPAESERWVQTLMLGRPIAAPRRGPLAA